LIVFGGNGFVGTRVCEEALQTGLAVVSINRSGAPKATAPWTSEVEWVKVSNPSTTPTRMSPAHTQHALLAEQMAAWQRSHYHAYFSICQNNRRLQCFSKHRHGLCSLVKCIVSPIISTITSISSLPKIREAGLA